MYTAKLNKKRRQVEARIDTNNSTACTVVVGLDGYDWKFYRERKKNVHISLNGPLQLTFKELEAFTEELKALVAEAREELEK